MANKICIITLASGNKASLLLSENVYIGPVAVATGIKQKEAADPPCTEIDTKNLVSWWNGCAGSR